MGTSAEAVAFHSFTKRWILAALWACFFFIGPARAEDSATDRVLQFLTNAHTGVAMNSRDWLGQEMQSSDIFNRFGGLEQMVKQSTGQAHKFGGLRSVRIISVAPKEAQLLIRAEVTFFDETRRRNSPSKAESGKMVWNIRATKPNSIWMLTF